MRKPRILPDSLRQKALRAGLPYHTVYQRIKFLGWPEEKALSTERLPRNSRSMVLKQLALEKGKVISVFPKREVSTAM